MRKILSHSAVIFIQACKVSICAATFVMSFYKGDKKLVLAYFLF